jgi:hypothetical protein
MGSTKPVFPEGFAKTNLTDLERKENKLWQVKIQPHLELSR